MRFHSGFFIAAIINLISAAPSLKRADVTTTVTLVNHCNDMIHVGQLGDTLLNGDNLIDIVSGSSKTYHFNGQWSGRFWARESCDAIGCQIAGAAFPASLAEFTFHGANGKDYYDISFVDGYNLPMRINPMQLDYAAQSEFETGKYWCGAPSCNVTPQCPFELQVWSANGAFVGCASACSKFGNSEYCCSGANDTPDKCPINGYAADVKNACPDVYSYAYDDSTSLYECRASGYTITWCPK